MFNLQNLNKMKISINLKKKKTGPVQQALLSNGNILYLIQYNGYLTNSKDFLVKKSEERTSVTLVGFFWGGGTEGHFFIVD